MEHGTVDREGMTLIGVETRTSNADTSGIGELWGRFYAEDLGSKIPGRMDDRIVAVYCEYEGDHTKPYTFFLGCQVNPGTDAPEGMSARTVDAGRFECVTAQGPQPETLIHAWTAIWQMPLDRRFDADYEIHYATNERVEIYVGV